MRSVIVTDQWGSQQRSNGRSARCQGRSSFEDDEERWRSSSMRRYVPLFVSRA